MSTYRCFCVTADNRIIAGANIEAVNVGTVVAVAAERWRHVPRLHFIEVWQASELLQRAAVPPSDPKPGSREQPK
jgi:hypothetical protein